MGRDALVVVASNGRAWCQHSMLRDWPVGVWRPGHLGLTFWALRRRWPAQQKVSWVRVRPFLEARSARSWRVTSVCNKIKEEVLEVCIYDEHSILLINMI